MPESLQPVPRKPIDRERILSSRRHEVPSQVWPNIRQEAVGGMRVGRSAKQTADACGLTQSLALELFFRAELQQLKSRVELLEDDARERRVYGRQAA